MTETRGAVNKELESHCSKKKGDDKDTDHNKDSHNGECERQPLSPLLDDSYAQ